VGRYYTLPSGWFAFGRTAFVAQEVEGFEDDDPNEETRRDSQGLLVDLAGGYRLPNRRGIIAVEVANLFDTRLSFQDESFRSSRDEANPRFLPSRTFLATVTLNF
jgi:outer membrane receptor protein involved in Fe transport